ncbi:MAG: hypothetical protein Kow0068_05200 [Marinilabiliales bacterium]
MKPIIKLIVIIYLSLFFTEKTSAQAWYSIPCDSLNYSGYQSTSSPYSALVFYVKTIKDKLYITGGFDTVYINNDTNIYAKAITVWDGSNWSALDDGVYNGIYVDDIKDIELFANDIYFGGSFAVSNGINITRWTDNGWNRLNEEPSNVVDELKSYNGLLYVAGGFGYIGTTLMPYFAAFDGLLWHNILKPNDNIRALEVFKGELYAGGSFGYIGNTSLNNVARFDGTQWHPLGNGTNCSIHAMAVDTINSFLYIGGCFSSVYRSDGSSIAVDGVGMWDGYQWNKVGYGDGIQWEVWMDAMAVYHGDLYVGLTSCEAAPIYSMIARWDGAKWDTLGNGLNNTVYGMDVFHDTLWVCGRFTNVDGHYTPQGLAKWYMPDTNCNYLKPVVYSLKNGALQDTFYITGGVAEVEFYNNNPYVDSWLWDFGDGSTDTIKEPVHIYTDTGTYNVSVTVTHNSCVKTATKTIVVTYPLNISELKNKEPGFKLYPNPAYSSLFIELTENKLLNNEIQIIDIKGNSILSVTLKHKKQSIDISTLPKGVYFVKLGEQVERFVKE